MLIMWLMCLLVVMVLAPALCGEEISEKKGLPLEPTGEAKNKGGLGPGELNIWWEDYREAMNHAEKEQRMLLIYFYDGSPACRDFERLTLKNDAIQKSLLPYVCLRVPTTRTIRHQGESIILLKHQAFAEMLGKPGIAIVDFAHPGRDFYGTVVSTFPFLNGTFYSPDQMQVILGLPPGTLTQRTLIYAVRVHPERPRSADGIPDPILMEEATRHADYQARIGLQGHHHWETRFQRLLSLLPGGLTPQEVCAESWPGQNLLEAAIECVRSWRVSSGHWRAVAAPHSRFGYDMKKGARGVWYATGVFARDRLWQ